MKKSLIAFLLCIAFLGTAAIAQNSARANGERMGRSFFESVDQQLARMTERLSLTADQQARIRPILAARDQQFQQLWNDGSLSFQERFSRAHTIQMNAHAKIEAVLNVQQRQIYDQFRGQRRNGAAGFQQNGR